MASGFSTGSMDAVSTMSEVIRHYDISEFNANTYIKMMPHITAANIVIFYGLTRRVIPTSCACASATQAIGYVNGHGMATEHGDIAETLATAELMPEVAISTQKSYFGHTLGACGALETSLSIEMMRERRFLPTINLHFVDPRCGKLDYILGAAREMEVEYTMSNNFAFGGINASLIVKRWQD